MIEVNFLPFQLDLQSDLEKSCCPSICNLTLHASPPQPLLFTYWPLHGATHDCRAIDLSRQSKLKYEFE